jgi:hypothetical protein
MLIEEWETDNRDTRTDDGFPIVLDFERTFAISYQEREIEQVFDRLRKVIRVDDESKKVDGAILLYEQVLNLYATHRRWMNRSRNIWFFQRKRTDVDHMLRRLVF